MQGVLSVRAIVEFLELWDILSSVELQPGVDDLIFGNSTQVDSTQQSRLMKDFRREQ